MLRAILLVCLGGLGLYTALAPLESSVRLVRLATTLPVFLLLAVAALLVWRGALRAASVLLVGGLWLIVAALTLYTGGVSAPPFAAMLVVVLLGGILFSGRVAIGLSLLSIGFGAFCTLAFSRGLIAVAPYARSDWSWLLAYAVYLSIAAQVISLMLSSVRAALSRAQADLAERRAAEAALRASEEKFARAFRAVPAGIAITRSADEIIIEVNEAYLRLSGRSRDQVVGRHADASDIWRDREQRLRVRDLLRRGGAVRDVEFDLLRADGSMGAGLLSAELVVVDGAACTLAAIIDITDLKQAAEERRRIETRMLQAQKLESLGLLAGGIAHDFNNLMSGVMGHSGLALIDLPPDSALRPNLLAIEQTARRAADLCQQLLAYAGKSVLSAQPIDLAALVSEMLGLIGISIGKQVSLAINLAPDLPPVLAEASQIRQVVLNLISNAVAAIEAIGGVGTITINARAGEFDSEELASLDSTGRLAPDRYVVLEVIDDGCGMNAETQQKIFDPFFTTKASGHGLGLAAVQGIALQHGGTIAVRSAPGVGTTFTLLLPPAPAPPAAAPPLAPAQTQPWATSGAVLVIDDEETVRMLAYRILERYGVPALMAANGAAGLEIVAARGDELAAVLLDLTMPGLSGVETLRRLRAIRPDLPVLLTSGYSAESALEIAGGNARIDFIQKPYRPQELIAKLQALVG